MNSFKKRDVIVWPQGTWGCGVALTSQHPWRQKITELILHINPGEPFVTAFCRQSSLEKGHLPLSPGRDSLGCWGGENCIANVFWSDLSYLPAAAFAGFCFYVPKESESLKVGRTTKVAYRLVSQLCRTKKRNKSLVGISTFISFRMVHRTCCSCCYCCPLNLNCVVRKPPQLHEAVLV